MRKIFKVGLVIAFAGFLNVVTSISSFSGITNFPGGVSSFGVPVLPGIGNNVYSGNVFWVDSTSTQKADGAGGGSYDQPFATINFASTQCTDNKSDVILVKPGHIETVTAAAGLDFNVAGITVIGLGTGSDRPTIRFTTATTADMNIDASNITMVNFIFEARVELLAAPIDVNATDTTFINIETRDIDGVGSCTNFIVCDANADRLLIDGHRHIGTSTSGTWSPISVVSLTGGDDIIIRNINYYGNFDYAGIMVTGTACTRLTIGGFNTHNQIWTENATDTAITALTSTGWIGPNIACMIQDDAANITEAVLGSNMQFIKPIEIVNLAGESSTQTNITSSTDA